MIHEADSIVVNVMIQTNGKHDEIWNAGWLIVVHESIVIWQAWDVIIIINNIMMMKDKYNMTVRLVNFFSIIDQKRMSTYTSIHQWKGNVESGKWCRTLDTMNCELCCLAIGHWENKKATKQKKKGRKHQHERFIDLAVH